MSTPHDPTLPALQERVHEMAASARRRNLLLGVGGALVLLFTLGYLTWAWSQIDDQLDAPTVVALAEQQADPYLSQPATQWASYLEDQAPALMDQAAEAALAAPPQLTEQLLSYVDSVVDEQLPPLEAEFDKLVADLIDRMAEAAGDDFKKGQFDDAQATELVDRVSAQFEESLQDQVDGLYDRYVAVSAGLIDRLNTLATGEDLSEKDRLHRDLVTSFLALAQRVQRGAGS